MIKKILVLLVLAGLFFSDLTVTALEIEMVVPGPATISHVFFTDLERGVVLGTRPKGKVGSALVYTEDGGITWKDASIDVDISDNVGEGLWMSNDKVGWAVTVCLHPRQQILLKTEDGGKTWKRQNAPALEKVWAITGIWFDSEGKKGWINTGVGPIFMTKNGGKNWIPVNVYDYEGSLIKGDKPLPTNFEHYGMYVFSFEHLILCGAGGAFLETNDAGLTWKATQFPLNLPSNPSDPPGMLTAIHFTGDGKNGWAVGNDGDYVIAPTTHAGWKNPVILHTTDGGKTWQRQNSEVISALTDVWALSEKEAWFCGTRPVAISEKMPGVLQHTTDGGKTWLDEHPGTNSLRKLFFLDPQHGWAVGGWAGGIEAESVLLRITP